jgi:DnaK suppressor protein
VTQQNLEALKQKLMQRKEELEKDLQRLSRETVYNEQVPDPADQASASTMDDVLISLQNTERDEYERIVQALNMINAGTYGICTDCGQPISEKRLQMYPNATRCLACQESLEDRK